MNIQKFTYILISGALIILLLVKGQSLLIPFVLGILLWFIMYKLKQVLLEVRYVKRNFPSWLLTVFSGLIVLGFVLVIINILSNNIATLSASYEVYKGNVQAVMDSLSGKLKIDVMDKLQSNISSNINFGNILSTILNSLTGVISIFFMVLVYTLFVVAEESNFNIKLRKIFKSQEAYDRFYSLLREIDSSISRYFGLKALLSLITGAASYVALLFIGIDSPGFWAFLIFILNFIPTIGSLIATVFPAIFALLQFVDFVPSLVVLVVVGAIQLIVGNILEPRMMGNSLNISPIVTILSLSLWGLIWGVTGMILSVPIMVVLIIILSKFEQTRNIAIMLSEKGNLQSRS